MAISVKEPTSVVVGYISGHNFFRGKYRDVQMRTEEGALVLPAHVETWSIEAHRTTKFWVLRPGEYRLLDHERPTIKTIRRDAARILASYATSELDAKTDANDERGNTTETWRIEKPDGQEYFVLIRVEAPDDDLYYEVLGAKPKPERAFLGDRANVMDVGGAEWVGPIVGPATIRISMTGTTARRYSLRIVEPLDKPLDAKSVPVGTTVEGRLGPRSSGWGVVVSRPLEPHDGMGWVDSYVFTNDQERTLYVAISWTPEVAHLQRPTFELTDDAGYRIVLEPLYDRERDQRRPPGVFATSKRVSGSVHVRIRSDDDHLTSGNYTVCVAADERVCARENLLEGF
jgi:hypothetical protein